LRKLEEWSEPFPTCLPLAPRGNDEGAWSYGTSRSLSVVSLCWVVGPSLAAAAAVAVSAEAVGTERVAGDVTSVEGGGE